MSVNKALLIINPCAGKNSKRIGATDIINSFSGADYRFDVKTTRCRGDATEIVKECGADYDVIICNGGDGTLNETVNGLLSLGKEVPVGYIPTGSTNDLAVTLGIPSDLTDAVELIKSGKKNTYDVGSLNGRYFNYVASFGMGTQISYSTPQGMKNRLGHGAYMLNAFVLQFVPMLKSFRPVKMKIEYDGGVLEDKFYFGSLSNSTSVAGLFKLDNHDVYLNDGYFELLLVRGLKKNIEAIGMLKKVIKKDYDGEKIILLKTKHVKITTDEPMPWTLDGEFGGSHEVSELDVMHNAFEIFSDNDSMFVSEK